MPKLTIDNIPVEVPAGTSVLEAAKSIGIFIPHFCYHPALGSVGACRLCAVKFLEGPVMKGIQMSCMIPAQDGMVVSTADPEAMRLRKLVIEWLMINHPHDCPVCDEGGECLLQDYTVAGGHGIRRYRGKKRTFLNQYLGPYIEHEMNRCIECYRCVRFYQDFAGGRDLGAMGSAGRVYFGRFAEGRLESPFSGNLLDICPTGVYTDKTARFRARYWDYDMAPSVCPWCSLGCNTVPAARYRELLKTMARRNDRVNGWFICDRGRFNNAPVNDPSRPRIVIVDGNETSWNDALETAARRIRELADRHGSESLAVIGSARLTLEAAVLLPRLRQALLNGPLCFFSDPTEASATAAAVSGFMADTAASMEDVGNADLIAIVDCNPLEDAPMLALAIRQAWRRGARISAVGSVPATALAKAVSIDVTPVQSLDDIAFDKAGRPVIICGIGRNIPAALPSGVKLACAMTGPNAFGAALPAREYGAVSLSEAVAGGKIKGMIAFEADIPDEFFKGIELVVAADWQETAAVREAHILLPTTAWVEMNGTFINNEGRAQRFLQAMNPGLPVKGLDPAVHPPHVHRMNPPGGNLLPAWRVIADLLERLGGERIEEPLTGRWETLRGLSAEGEGIKIANKQGVT